MGSSPIVSTKKTLFGLGFGVAMSFGLAYVNATAPSVGTSKS